MLRDCLLVTQICTAVTELNKTQIAVRLADQWAPTSAQKITGTGMSAGPLQRQKKKASTMPLSPVCFSSLVLRWSTA